MKQREIPNEKYDYLYEMRTLCIMNNMIFLQCVKELMWLIKLMGEKLMSEVSKKT